jgi:hypothetical protein
MTDLEILADKFKKWRGSRRRAHYPESFWDEIRKLAEHHSISSIAESCAINPCYLRQKLLKNSKQMTFAHVQLVLPPPQVASQVAIELSESNRCLITVRFQADYEQLTRIILSLSERAS